MWLLFSCPLLLRLLSNHRFSYGLVAYIPGHPTFKLTYLHSYAYAKNSCFVLWIIAFCLSMSIGAFALRWDSIICTYWFNFESVAFLIKTELYTFKFLDLGGIPHPLFYFESSYLLPQFEPWDFYPISTPHHHFSYAQVGLSLFLEKETMGLNQLICFCFFIGCF